MDFENVEYSDLFTFLALNDFFVVVSALLMDTIVNNSILD